MSSGEGFTTVRSVGGLLPSDLLARVAASDPELPGTGVDDYHLAAGERLREVVARSWHRLVGAWEGFEQERARLLELDRGTTLTREKWLLVLFQELGYGRLQTTPAIRIDEREYPVSHGWGHVPLHLLSYKVELDRRTEGVSGAARMSPHAMVQELLNRSGDYRWALVSNGLALRLLRDNASMSRQAYVEFDLAAMMEGQVYADFVLLWLLCHQSRVEGERPDDCWLERWVEVAAREGARALDKLRDGVEAALTTLGSGLLAHPANAELRAAVRSGEISTQELYRQFLRVVYRLLFLFVAEDRDLLLLPTGQVKPDARERYDRYYSTRRLRQLARRQPGGRHDDLWEQLTLVFDLLGSDDGCEGLALPPLGSGLWDPQATDAVVGSATSRTRLENRDLLEAIRQLAWTVDGRVVRAVDYRNLGAEELGSVYESLLELHPQVHVEDQRFALTAGAGNERKTTGSYYTPVSLIEQLLDTALDPVLDRAMRAEDPEQALLATTVCDPACGSGHFLVAAAHRMAGRLAAVRTGDSEASPEALQEALRDVVSRCIYGVDVNPMAIELAKVSLWVEAQVPGKPLTFLDHHLKSGNSLLGTTPALVARGIPDEAFKPLQGDDKAMCTSYRKRNRRLRAGQQSLLAADPAAGYDILAGQAAELTDLDDDSIEALQRKQVEYQRLESSEQLRLAKLTADAWCAAFTAPKVPGNQEQQPFELFYELRDGTRPPTSPAYTTVAEQARAFAYFHWHLEFPHLFEPVPDPVEDDPTGWTGGFNVMLGNPPWDRVKLQEKEWFATRAPEIADAPNAATRGRRIKALYEAEPGTPERALSAEWDDAQRRAQVVSELLRSSGRFPLGGVGDVNVYAVFADLFHQTIDERGRAGFVCPTGLAVGATYADFFGQLVESRRLHSFYSFENEDLLFPAITNKNKMALVTLTGRAAPVERISFTGYVRQAREISSPDRRYELTAEQIAAINPNTLTAPLFRRSRDAEVTAAIHAAAPVLLRDDDPDGNPWQIDFLRMFDMTNDSGHFVTYENALNRGGCLEGTLFRLPDGGRLLPLYEGKMVWHYDHRYGTYEGQTRKQANKGVLPHVTNQQHADPDFRVRFRYWVPEGLVDKALARRWDRRWMIGWRDVGPSERTMVCAVTPTMGSGNKFPLLLSAREPTQVALLYSALCALVTDFALRQKSASQLNYFVVKQAPVPVPPGPSDQTPWETALFDFVLPRVVELSCTDRELAPFAEDLGYVGPPFRWDPERRVVLQAELDAFFFHLYGLERDDVAWVLDSFTVLRKYEERNHGEFRTKRLVLDRYDAMTEANTTGRYKCPLEVPPADDAIRHGG